MKRERAFVENRRKQILDKIIDSPGIHVEELADLFRVSAITIRRDLQYLYRDQIARYAATLVEDGDTVFINTSRTALQILQYIRKKNVTVITNNGRALSCDHPDGVNVILTGGELRYPKEAMVGEFAERNLLKCYAKLAFVGCSGISEESGVTTDNANEVNLNELMLRRATKCAYILADHTKIGSMSSFRTCSIERVTNLVTDERAPKEILDIFREKGIDVHQVSRNDIFE